MNCTKRSVLIIVGEGVPDSRVEEEKKKGDLEVIKIDGFSGTKASSVTLLTNEPAKLLDSDDLTKIFETILVSEGKLILKSSEEIKGELGIKLAQQLRFSGYISVNVNGDVITAEKDKFEVGESVALSFAKPNGGSTNKTGAWKVSADDDDEDDLIDDDALLDENDLKKPDPTSLRVCGTTGKRKACKDCSCGLAEELDAEVKAQIATGGVKSSCGSCYLGDAFRCATCPYLGTPAFKPGEKVQLADSMLQPDV